MSTVGEEEVEYESDPEEATRALAMRRREASEDEDDYNMMSDRRGEIHSDESDGLGGAAEYDDNEEELEVEDEDEDEEDIYDDEEEDAEKVEECKEMVDESSKRIGAAGPVGNSTGVREFGSDVSRNDDEALEDSVENNLEEDGEKKENEPFAVPTAGAFYMHDDRFRDSAGGRNRRTLGGRKLWESKDDKKWGHDKFEEMNFPERQHEEGRTSRGFYRSRGKSKGLDHGYPRRSRSKVFNNNNQNQNPKGTVRGRGPRRYETAMRDSSQAPPLQAKQARKLLDKSSQQNSVQAYVPTTNTESSHVAAKNIIVASSLNSASPPFYPSATSTKDIPLTQKRDVHAENINRNPRPSAIDQKASVPQANALLRGKNIADSVAMDKLFIDKSSTQVVGKTLTNLQLSSSGSSLVNSARASQYRVQGRGVPIPGQMTYLPTQTKSQISRVSPTTQSNQLQSGPAQIQMQPASQVRSQHPGSGSQASSPSKTALSVTSYGAGDVDSPSIGKSKDALVGRGQGSLQGSGRGSFLYNGAQVIGANGNGDQNFPGTPTFLPVMQFGGQHPGGLGVPAVGMAYPGYVGNPQLGMGNSEMTWLPVLAGAAGALGATYCSPYIAVDGSYHSRPTGQSSSIGSSSKENNANKPNNEWKPSQKPEPVVEEFGQPQNNPNKQPRRYSEMSFSK